VVLPPYSQAPVLPADLVHSSTAGYASPRKSVTPSYVDNESPVGVARRLVEGQVGSATASGEPSSNVSSSGATVRMRVLPSGLT
jgi:hypothetical protein